MAGSLTSSFCILLDPGKQLSTSRQLNYALISALKWKCAFLWLFNNFYYLRFAPFQTPVVVAAAIVSMTALTSFTNSVVIPEAHAATNLTLHRTLKVDCAFFFFCSIKSRKLFKTKNNTWNLDIHSWHWKEKNLQENIEGRQKMFQN